MPRMRKPASERLTDSLNIPVTTPLKRRVIGLARRQRPRPVAPTNFVRGLIEECVNRLEREEAAGELAAAK